MAKDKEMEVEASVEEGDADTLRVYELGFHIDPELSQEEVKKTYTKLHEAIMKNATRVAEGEPKKIPLAYTIFRSEVGGRRDFDSSYFAWIAYETDQKGHEAALVAARAESRIIRFIDIRTDKDAAKHAEEMQDIFAKMPEEPVAADDVVDADLDAALKEVGV